MGNCLPKETTKHFHDNIVKNGKQVPEYLKQQIQSPRGSIAGLKPMNGSSSSTSAHLKYAPKEHSSSIISNGGSGIHSQKNSFKQAIAGGADNASNSSRFNNNNNNKQTQMQMQQRLHGHDLNLDEQQSNLSRSTVSNAGVTTSGYSSNSANSNFSNACPTSNKNTYIALFDYDSRTSDDLSFKKGDKFYIDDADKKSNGWWLARLIATNSNSPSENSRRVDQRGFIPSNFVARLDSLESEPWYFGVTKRIEAEKLLMHESNEHGAYLIRISDGSNHAYSLSVRDQDSVKHYRIRKSDENNCFYITKRAQFSTLNDLVAYYSSKPDGLTVQLMKPCIKLEMPVTEGLTHNFKDNFEVDRSLFILEKKIGQGQFGDVWQGIFKINKMKVAIKTLKEGMNPDDFKAEAAIMKDLSHPKLIQLYALCTTEEPIYIITELMTNGSLLEYLQKPTSLKSLKIDTLVYISSQIASGMAYLESRNFIHRDLAARNVLVGDNNEVKVADFGLARVVKDKIDNIYAAREGTKFPIKWTAPEAAIYNKFSVKSDVWSFGIVLTEIVTFGRTPYPSMSNQEVLQQVARSYRMPQPPGCPPRLYKIMLDCWKSSPDDRPTFETLKWQLETYFDEDDKQYRDTQQNNNNSSSTTTNSASTRQSMVGFR